MGLRKRRSRVEIDHSTRVVGMGSAADGADEAKKSEGCPSEWVRCRLCIRVQCSPGWGGYQDCR